MLILYKNDRNVRFVLFTPRLLACNKIFCLIGKFTVSIAGVYKVGLYVFAADCSEGKLDLIVKKGRWEKTQCAAHSDADSYRAASCGTLLQLEEGDELYAKGNGPSSGALHTPPYVKHSSMEAYLLYKASP